MRLFVHDLAFCPPAENDFFHKTDAAAREAALQRAMAHIPAMQRRRLTPLGRHALAALARLKPKANEAMVFASSWGDIGRSYDLLQSLSQSGDMSPAAFASSVHNAIGAAASIWLKNKTAYRAICAGKLTASMAFVESALLLASFPTVLVVRYEMPLPEAWENNDITEPTDTPAAWAARVSLSAAENETHPDAFSLTVVPSDCARVPTDAAFAIMPHHAQIASEIDFLCARTCVHEEGDGVRSWQWLRDAQP